MAVRFENTIQLPSSLEIKSRNPIDVRILLTKEQMLAIDYRQLPEKYFAICKDDGKLYLYDVANENNAETGKYRVLEADVDLSNYATKEELQALANLLDSLATKESVNEIKDLLSNLKGEILNSLNEVNDNVDILKEILFGDTSSESSEGEGGVLGRLNSLENNYIEINERLQNLEDKKVDIVDLVQETSEEVFFGGYDAFGR